MEWTSLIRKIYSNFNPKTPIQEKRKCRIWSLEYEKPEGKLSLLFPTTLTTVTEGSDGDIHFLEVQTFLFFLRQITSSTKMKMRRLYRKKKIK